MSTDKIHRFEKAGLGRAPFRFVDVEYRVGPITYPNGMTVGAPGQPMGACDFCGQGIAECCIIQDADGKRFVVGNQCVYKTGDQGLTNTVKRVVDQAKAKRRAERERKRIAEAKEALPEVADALKAEPHPMAWLAEKGMTLLDYVEWNFKKAGHTGQLKVTRMIEKALKAKEEAR